MNKIAVLILLSVFLISMVGAETPVYKVDEDVVIRHSITYNGSIVDSANITVYDPDNVIIIDFQEMTKNGLSDFNYTIPADNITIVGRTYSYTVCGYGTENECFGLEFIATKNGNTIDEGNSTLFMGGLFFLVIGFIASIIGVVKVEHYIGKFALYWTSHVLFVGITFSAWQIFDSLSIGFTGLAGVFKVLFYVSTIAMFPMVLASLSWIFYIHLMNDTIKGMMDRGMDQDEAYRRARRKKNG